MKRVFVLLLVATMAFPVLGATFAGFQKTQEAFFDGTATDPVSYSVPTTGLVITMTAAGYVFVTPTSGPIVFNLSATTPNVNTYSGYVPDKGSAKLEQFYRPGQKFALAAYTTTTTVNVTIQKHRTVNE
jgi:hypothetical protein